MSTIQLKTPDELYQLAPDLATIAERLENSVKNTEIENQRIQSQKRKNKDTPGVTLNTFKTRYPEHFRIIEILKQGRWEKMPTELKFGREQFEREITTIAATRNPQAMKIAIYVGKRKITTPETYTVYLEEGAKTTQPLELGNPNESEKIKELELKYVALSQATGNPNSVELLKADFAMQLNNFKHLSEIENLKRNHERELERKDDEISKLQDEVEDLEEQVLESDKDLSGAAELINAKQKPPAFMEILSGVIVASAKKLAIENPQYLSAVTNKSPEEIKQMFIEDAKACEISSATKIENDNSENTFSEVENEYEGYDPAHANQLKNLHVFAKALSLEDCQTFYNICAYCCLPNGSINKENATSLLEFIASKQQQ